jgi:lysophospholipase L1-like esterase
MALFLSAAVTLFGAAITSAVTMAAALGWQLAFTRQGIPEPQGPPPRGDVSYGRRTSQPVVTLVVLGDSFAAGYGADRSRDTPAAFLAAGMSRRLRRRVSAHTLAVMGAETPDLRHQVDRALALAPDLAVIYIGGNDVTMLSAQRDLVRQLGAEVRRLRAAGCEVVVGTCPDLGVLPPFRPPLRWLARFLSRRLAAAQTAEVVRAGGYPVSLADLLNPYFVADPERMFGHDRFHPSSAGYARAAAVTLPTLLRVVANRTSPVAEVPPRPLPEAAARADTQVHPAAPYTGKLSEPPAADDYTLSPCVPGADFPEAAHVMAGVPIAWFTAEVTAHDLLLWAHGPSVTSTIEYRATEDVLALTWLFVHADNPMRLSVPAARPVAAHLRQPWWTWCEAELDEGFTTLPKEDLRLALRAWRRLGSADLLGVATEHGPAIEAAQPEPHFVGLHRARRIVQAYCEQQR